jgi:drug/metabolite transporter (DMT)-like permease
MAHSSHGTALSLQKGVSPAMKLYWRMISVAFTLLFFAVPSFCKNGFPKLNFGQWSTLLLAAFCYSTQNLCFVTALDYTSIGNVVLFANTQAVLLLAGKALTGTPVLCLEVLGASIAVGGAMLCATDTHRDKVDVEGDEDVSSAIRGDILAMMSALLGVGYLTFAKAVRPLTPVLSFMFIMMCTGSFIVLSFMAIMHEQITFDNHPYHGLFGWVNWRPDRLPVELWIVFVVSLIGTMGFIRALMYFDSIVIAVATLLEPMTASIIATIAHVGVLPGPQGWVGNLLVILGTFGVVYPSATKEAASSEH